MKLTVGPLPAAVYWKRRLMVGVPVVAVLAVAGVLAFGGHRGGDPVTVSDASSSSPKAASGQGAHPASTLPAPAPSNTAPSASPSSGQASPSKATSSGPGSSGSNSSEPGSSKSGSSSPSPTEATCSDSDLDVTAYLTKSSWTTGDQPKLRMSVTNNSKQVCRGDLGRSSQHFAISDHTGKLVWSSDFCQPSTGHKNYPMPPGKHRIFSITWAGTSASAGCHAQRKQVHPGTYRLTTTLGSVKSKPRPFTMKAPTPDSGSQGSPSGGSPSGKPDTGGVDPATI